MNFARKALVSVALGGLAVGAAGAQPQLTTGPVAVYWMSAATSSGMGGMPGIGGMGGGMPGAGGGAPPPQARPPT